MISILLHILSLVGQGAKAAWTWIRAKALLLWAFGSVVLPKFLDFFSKIRLLRISCIGAFFYVVYTTLGSMVRLVEIVFNFSANISDVLGSAGWAGWIIWDGPLNMKVLWSELLDALLVYSSFQFIAYALTKAEYFTNNLFGTTGIGPRR